MENTYYIIKVGNKKYYCWDRVKQVMKLTENIEDAYRYSVLKEAQSDIELMEEGNRYKSMKKRIYKVESVFEEVL